MWVATPCSPFGELAVQLFSRSRWHDPVPTGLGGGAVAVAKTILAGLDKRGCATLNLNLTFTLPAPVPIPTLSLSLKLSPGRRQLRQGYTCQQAKALTPDTCKILCGCVTQKAAGDTQAATCPGACNACAAAAATCTGDALPADCATYAGNAIVQQCIASGGRRLL